MLLVATRAPKGYRFFKNGDSASKWKRYHPHIVRPLARPVPTTYIFFIFQNLRRVDDSRPNVPLALPPSPLVPSVFCGVGVEMGPTFWKRQKCAGFRRLHRYRLHLALVVAFSFGFENGAPAAEWENGGLLEAGTATSDTWRSC